MIKGSCLCGAVAFEVDGKAIEMNSCHCSKCRKAYGAAFGTILVVKRDDFTVVKGADLVTDFQSSERVNRPFCSSCGSRLPIVEEWDSLVGIPAGLLDDDPGIKNGSHSFVGSKANWWEFSDTSPRHREWPPQGDLESRYESMKPAEKQEPPEQE